MIAPPSYLYEVSSARAPEGFHSVKEEPQRKDFQVDFPFENPTGYKKPTARSLRSLTKSHVGTLQISTLKRDQPHHSPQKTSYAVLSSESSSHTGYICVLAVSPAQLFPSPVPYLLQHYTVTAHKGSILHASMRSSDGHTRRDAFRWKGPNIKCTSVA